MNEHAYQPAGPVNSSNRPELFAASGSTSNAQAEPGILKAIDGGKPAHRAPIADPQRVRQAIAAWVLGLGVIGGAAYLYSSGGADQAAIEHVSTDSPSTPTAKTVAPAANQDQPALQATLPATAAGPSSSAPVASATPVAAAAVASAPVGPATIEHSAADSKITTAMLSPSADSRVPASGSYSKGVSTGTSEKSRSAESKATSKATGTGSSPAKVSSTKQSPSTAATAARSSAAPAPGKASPSSSTTANNRSKPKADETGDADVDYLATVLRLYGNPKAGNSNSSPANSSPVAPAIPPTAKASTQTASAKGCDRLSGSAANACRAKLCAQGPDSSGYCPTGLSSLAP